MVSRCAWSSGRSQARGRSRSERLRRIQTATRPQPRDLRLRALLEEIDEGFFALDWECRYLHANAIGGGHHAGKPLEELLGHTPWELFPALQGGPLQEHYRQAMELGRPSVA